MCLMTSPQPVPGAAQVRASVYWVSVNVPPDTTAKTAPSVSIKVQGVPKKPGLAIEDIRSELNTKEECVLKKSGYFLSNGQKTQPTLPLAHFCCPLQLVEDKSLF